MELFRAKFKWLVLFTSSTCLLCCALPILLVSLGMGTVMASLVSSFPFMVTLSQHKEWTFIISGIVLVIAAFAIFRPGRICPTDPVLAEQCKKADKWNIRFLSMSVCMWVVGIVSAYVLPLLEI